MRARHALIFLLLLIVLTSIRFADPIRETYIGMAVQEVGGRPYLVLQEKETFSIFAPVGEAQLEGWKPVFDSRLGYVFGTFELSKNEGEIKPGLGLFFEDRFAVLDVSSEGKNGTPALAHGLDWPPETAAELGGKVYCFGAKLDAQPDADAGAKPANKSDGVLKAARLDAAKWIEVPGAALSDFHFGKGEKPGFWLHSVAVGGKIAVIWRTIEFNQTVGLNVEGQRMAGEGDTWISVFDGEKFSTPLALKLPAGNLSVREAGGRLAFTLQTRAGKTGSTESEAGRVETWSVGFDGSAKFVEGIAPGNSRLGLFAFIAAERFQYKGGDYVLRSTWQRFEALRKNEVEKWVAVPGGGNGLPVFTLEHWLYIALGFCAATVLFGAGLAFVRRRKTLALLEKVQTHELLAPLGMRAGACVLDWAVVLAATIVAAHFDSERFIDILPSPLDLPYAPFMLCALGYYVCFEWLSGTTPGKFAMGLCVSMDDGQRAGLWPVFVRNLLGLYERHPLYILMIAAPMLLFSPRRQRLGDLLSRTVVVQRRGLERVRAQLDAALAAKKSAVSELFGKDDGGKTG